MAAGHKINGI